MAWDPGCAAPSSVHQLLGGCRSLVAGLKTCDRNVAENVLSLLGVLSGQDWDSPRKSGEKEELCVVHGDLALSWQAAGGGGLSPWLEGPPCLSSPVALPKTFNSIFLKVQSD